MDKKSNTVVTVHAVCERIFTFKNKIIEIQTKQTNGPWLSSQESLILIWSTLEGWKDESALEPSNGFEHQTLVLGIQRPTYQAIAPFNSLITLLR